MSNDPLISKVKTISTSNIEDKTKVNTVSKKNNINFIFKTVFSRFFKTTEEKNFELVYKEYLYNLNKEIARKEEKIILNSIKEENRDLIINDTFTRIYYLAELPDFVSYNAMMNLLNTDLPLSISMFIKGTQKGIYLKAIRARKSIITANQIKRLKESKDRDPEIDKEINNIENLIDEMMNENQKAFHISLYVAVSAPNREQLRVNCENFEGKMADIDFLFYPRTFQQASSLPAMLPLLNNSINEKNAVQTNAMTEILPFLGRTNFDVNGFFLGVSRINNNLILLDLWKAKNANLMLFGTSGSGKSVTSKLLLKNLTANQVQCIILDPEGEYEKINEKINGVTYSFSNNESGSKTKINIFDIDFVTPQAKVNHIAALKNFFNDFIKEDRKDDADLDKMLVKLYEGKERNIRKFIEICQGLEFEKDLEIFTTGSLSGIFNSEEKIDLTSISICFNLESIGEHLKAPVMYIIASIIDSLIDQKDRRRMLFIDEAHLFLKNKFSTDFYLRLQKTVRKRKAGVISITQNVEDFRSEVGADVILTQAETIIILQQSAKSVEFLKKNKIFPLHEKEYDMLISQNKGEAILFRESEHIYINVEPFESDWKYIETGDNNNKEKKS